MSGKAAKELPVQLSLPLVLVESETVFASATDISTAVNMPNQFRFPRVTVEQLEEALEERQLLDRRDPANQIRLDAVFERRKHVRRADDRNRQR